MFETFHLRVAASYLALAGLVMAPQIVRASQVQRPAARAEHSVAGEVKKLDHATKTLVIRTADGVDETVKFTDRTTVRGLKDVTRAVDTTAKAGLEGGAIVLYYTGEGAAKTAVRLDRMGKRTLRIARGTVVRVDEAGKYIVLKTSAGSEETFGLTKDTVVEGSRGIEEASVVTGGTIRKGAEVTIHYSNEGGRKLVHVLKHL